MFFAQWRARRANRTLIDQLHGKIVAASRRPALYRDFGVPDTFEGRFEMVALHAGLVIRRLSRSSGVGPELGQELTDSVFRHFEVALREIGVGDITVPKRLKRMGEAYFGRNQAYGEGLDEAGPQRLVTALARNVYGADADSAPMAADLARFVRAASDLLERTPIERFARGDVEFPDLHRTSENIGVAHG